jgi:hypothetical protein
LIAVDFDFPHVGLACTLGAMPRKPPPLEVEVVIETSPEARQAYLEAIKLLIRYTHEDREQHKLTPLSKAS